MTIFTTELFKLDLTHLNIKFSDENQFFEKDLIKQQSFPFRVPRERSFLSFFEFIESHNSTESNRYIKGTLFRNDTYYQAELMVLRISKDIEAVIYYAHDNLTIFNKNLKDLPWPTIEVGDSIFDFAKQTILKDYPETVVNFPRIYAPELYKENDFGQYTGFINQITDGEFIDELPNPFNLPFHNYIMNEIRPFTYLREVLKVIFDEIGYTISGDLITNQSFQKCLLYNENPIFYTNNDFNKLVELDYYNLSFIERVYNYLPSNIRYGLSLHSVVIEFPGTYDVNLNFNGMIYRTDTDSPNFGGNIYIECYFNNELLEEYIITNTNTMTSFFYDVAFNFKLDVPSSLSGRNFEIKIISTGLEDGLMVGKYELNGTKRPLYKNQFSLSDIVPDMLVGDFLSAVKETFVMTSVFDTATKKVYFNFFNSFIENKEAIDLSKYNQTSVPRKLYKSIGYNISFTDGESLFLDKSGNFTEAVSGFEKYLIPIEPLKKVYVNFTQNVKHQDGLSMLFFESNTNANPLFVDGDVSFTRIGFVHNFLRNWLYQKLNSEEYNLTVDLPLFISSKLNSAAYRMRTFSTVYGLTSVMFLE